MNLIYITKILKFRRETETSEKKCLLFDPAVLQSGHEFLFDVKEKSLSVQLVTWLLSEQLHIQ